MRFGATTTYKCLKCGFSPNGSPGPSNTVHENKKPWRSLFSWLLKHYSRTKLGSMLLLYSNYSQLPAEWCWFLARKSSALSLLLLPLSPVINKVARGHLDVSSEFENQILFWQYILCTNWPAYVWIIFLNRLWWPVFSSGSFFVQNLWIPSSCQHSEWQSDSSFWKPSLLGGWFIFHLWLSIYTAKLNHFLLKNCQFRKIQDMVIVVLRLRNCLALEV